MSFLVRKTQALGRILGRISRVCSDSTNTSRNHPVVCVPAAKSPDAVSAECSSQDTGMFALRPMLSPRGGGHAKENPPISFAPLIHMYYLLKEWLAPQVMPEGLSVNHDSLGPPSGGQ